MWLAQITVVLAVLAAAVLEENLVQLRERQTQVAVVVELTAQVLAVQEVQALLLFVIWGQPPTTLAEM
jgi:isochorismate hydrolase